MNAKKIWLTIAAGAVLFSLSDLALAVASVPDAWFIEGNFGSSHVTNISYPGPANRSGIGGNLNVGYKFMPFVAAEIGYSRYENAGIEDVSTDTTAATVKRYSYDLAVRGILPIYKTGLELFAKFGAGRPNAHVSVNNDQAAANLGIGNSSHSTTNIYYGGGVQYYMMPELALVVQWQRAQGDNSTGNFDLITGGLSLLLD